MAIKYLSSDYAIYPEGDSLTEQEHKDSCDINKMIKNAARGLQVRGGSEPKFGYDDTTMDGVQFRIQKEQLEKSLSEISRSNEFSPDELKHVPENVKKKFKFRQKAEQKPVPKNDELNDEKKDGLPLPTPTPTPTPTPAPADPKKP